MLFTVKEITRWLGITVLELFLFLMSATVTVVLVMLRCTGDLDPSMRWEIVLSPLFVCDTLNCYFCVIVMIRMKLYNMLRPGVARFIWSLVMIGLNTVFKVLLCKKLNEPNSLEFSAVLAPIFIVLQLIMIRACHIKTTSFR